KHGVIAAPGLFDICRTGWQSIKSDWQTTISRAIAVKINVVNNDPFEHGERAVLNLGHTFGHAVETASDYSIRHGEAVSIGMVTAGVLLIWRVVTVRYGDVRLDTLITRIGGLSKPMPIFGVLVFFIAWAAVGLPPFGLFAGFIEVLMGMSAKLSWHTFVVLFTWLMASWYFIMFLQKVLFGPKKLSFEYKRLKYNEGISLVIVLIILLMLGVGIIKMPSDGVVLTGNDKNTKTEVISWVK
ncbi:MAG: hypothetical protein KAR06_01975, partial [Deltaproteobacteria bacterium]|nr:hypothetical protein [Deltaproteobacteria bacterium]